MTTPTRSQKRREPTAAEKIAALDELRRSNEGYVVPRPPLPTVEAFRAWLEQVSEVGSAGDVEIAWHYVDNTPWKDQLHNDYRKLCAAAGQRHHQLWLQAEEEQRLARIAHEERTLEAGRQREIAKLEAKLAVLKA